MQYKNLKIEYVLPIILLLGLSEPILAKTLKTSNWKLENRRLLIGHLTLDSLLPARDAVSKKYAYAELLYQVHFSIPKFRLVGKTVPPQLITAVNAANNRDEALDLLGDSGWELISVITRNFDGGFELFFFFKKTVD
ncbi:MAG: hypothetical protein H7Y86_15525 [Rhizobacter sp.]|nr:hypothetical protein [Ferruginibacter sp.]